MTFDPLENPTSASDKRFDRRWSWFFILFILAFLLLTIFTIIKAPNPMALSSTAIEKGSLPDPVRSEVLRMLTVVLEDPKLHEERHDGIRVFIITGVPRDRLAQDFNKKFNPLVVEKIIPMLKPFGEIINFQIANVDPPPVRLHSFPESQ